MAANCHFGAHVFSLEAYDLGSESLKMDTNELRETTRCTGKVWVPNTFDSCFCMQQTFIPSVHDAHDVGFVDDFLQICLVDGVVYLLEERHGGRDGCWEESGRRATVISPLKCTWLPVIGAVIASASAVWAAHHIRLQPAISKLNEIASKAKSRTMFFWIRRLQ